MRFEPERMRALALKLAKTMPYTWHGVERKRTRDLYSSLERAFGVFNFDQDYRAYAVRAACKETGQVRGEIVHALQHLSDIQSLFLPGEDARTKEVYSDILGIPTDAITTAGLHEQVDHRWDFEDPPPTELGRYDCVISQAILEHLFDPAQHAQILAGMLNPGGHLLLHVPMPGFHYHRYPRDCLRFYPDWFERLAELTGLMVARRDVQDYRVMYVLKRPRD